MQETLTMIKRPRVFIVYNYVVDTKQIICAILMFNISFNDLVMRSKCTLTIKFILGHLFNDR